jgi:hypothetical protein
VWFIPLIFAIVVSLIMIILLNIPFRIVVIIV